MQYRIILILILLSISRLAVSQNIDQQLDSLILIANNIQRTDINDNRKLTDTDLKILAKYTNFKQLTLNKLGEIRDTNQVLKTYEYLAMINSNLNIHTQAVELYYKILKIYEIMSNFTPIYGVIFLGKDHIMLKHSVMLLS